MTTRWAMVGTGFMLQLIARDFGLAEGVQLQVLVSRSEERARQAAQEHGIPESSGDLGAVLARDDIDIVYVATPHTQHASIARAALEAGKAVLVEKPMTTNAADTRALCAFAQERGLFLAEAMWTAFAPAIVDLRQRVAAEEIGEVQLLTASFSFAFPRKPDSRLWDPQLGGGTTLDQGVYPLSLAHMVLGAPTSITAVGTVRDGVDVEVVSVLDHAKGARSVCTTSMRAIGHSGALIAGTKGAIELPPPFWAADRLTVRTLTAPEPVEVVHEREGAGYTPMLEAVSSAVLAGETQHELRTHAESIAVAETMDEVLAQVHRQAAG
jgi:predicted dehydrogenase